MSMCNINAKMQKTAKREVIYKQTVTSGKKALLERIWEGRGKMRTLFKLYIYSLYIYISICGEGSGNPLQYSCLENPMDGGAWWAAVHGVARSRT